MPRSKLKLAYITNGATRRATLKKRKQSLIKKVEELSTLCDIKACAVIYDPAEKEPDVYPSERAAKELLLQFKSMPETEQSRKRVDQEEYIRQKIMKTEDQIRKQQRDNRELELMAFAHECLIGVRSVGECQAYEDMVFLLSFIEEKMKAVAEMKEKKRMMDYNKLAIVSADGYNDNLLVNSIPSSSMNVDGQAVMDGGYGVGGGLEEVVKPFHTGM